MRTGLTIGEFATLSHLSVRTLRRYHQTGLQPTFTHAKTSQLPVARHRTIRYRPAEVSATEEAPRLLPAPVFPYDLPVYASPKVQRDHHIFSELGYSVLIAA